jgi:hypothetical protein
VLTAIAVMAAANDKIFVVIVLTPRKRLGHIKAVACCIAMNSAALQQCVLRMAFLWAEYRTNKAPDCYRADEIEPLIGARS